MKHYLAKLIRRSWHPSERPSGVQRIFDHLGLWHWRWNLWQRARAGTLNHFGARLVRIDPSVIDSQIPLSALPLRSGTVRDAVGWTLGGTWDLAPVPLAAHAVFIGIRQRFGEGAEWRETVLHARARQGLEQGRPLWKFRHAGDLPRLFAKIDELHAAMARDGYKTQAELGSVRRWDEVLVAIDRHGRRHLVDGAHRLALAQVMGFASVPVLVAVCHRDWEEPKDV